MWFQQSDRWKVVGIKYLAATPLSLLINVRWSEVDSFHRDRHHAILSICQCWKWLDIGLVSKSQRILPSNTQSNGLTQFKTIPNYFSGTFQSCTIHYCWRVSLWVRRSRYPEGGPDLVYGSPNVPFEIGFVNSRPKSEILYCFLTTVPSSWAVAVGNLIYRIRTKK